MITSRIGDWCWGCERPALLLAETLALHDRRTEDLDTDPSGKKVGGR